MKRLADRFHRAASECASVRSLEELLRGAVLELGFDFFALLHHASLTRPERPYIRIDNYPRAWALELSQSKWAAKDPVHLASRTANAVFRWGDLGRLISLGREQRAILERSRYYGLGEGLTVPVNVPGEPPGSCSFAVRRGSKLPGDRLLCAELIGLHAFEAARRLAPAPAPQRPHLSPREVQCIRLLAAGKSDWEIAVILGISVETARQYVKRARAAYDAPTRAQLVALGLRDQWLSFDDAVDCRG